MVRIETIEKHVNFLRKLQKEIKTHNGAISLTDYARKYKIGQGHMQEYKRVGLITPIGNLNRTTVFEFKKELIEPIAIRRILEAYNNSNNPQITVSKHISSTKNEKKDVIIDIPEIKAKKKYVRKINNKKSDVGLIRQFLKWIY